MKLAVRADNELLLKALIQELQKNGFERNADGFHDVDEAQGTPYIWIDNNKYTIADHEQLYYRKQYKIPYHWDYLASLKPEQDVELKVGMYLKDTALENKYMLISSFDGNDVRYANGGFDPIYDVKEYIKTGRYTIPTTKEITEYLKNEAIRKYSGKKVKCLKGWDTATFNYDSLFYDSTSDIIWIHPQDSTSVCIYHKGKWAETVTIAGYEINDTDESVLEIGCFALRKNTIDDIQDALDKHIYLQIYIDGKDVTNELKNLDI